jgi:hypothetical protein
MVFRTSRRAVPSGKPGIDARGINDRYGCAQTQSDQCRQTPSAESTVYFHTISFTVFLRTPGAGRRLFVTGVGQRRHGEASALSSDGTSSRLARRRYRGRSENQPSSSGGSGTTRIPSRTLTSGETSAFSSGQYAAYTGPARPRTTQLTASPGAVPSCEKRRQEYQKQRQHAPYK